MNLMALIRMFTIRFRMEGAIGVVLLLLGLLGGVGMWSMLRIYDLHQDFIQVPWQQNQQLQQMQSKLDALQLKEKENIKLSTEVRVLKENPQTVNNNINLLVNFGQENIDEILAKLPNLLQDTLTKHLGQSIPYLTKQIHCNQELFPEYNNVYIESYRNPFAMIFQNGQFCDGLKNVLFRYINILCIRSL